MSKTVIFTDLDGALLDPRTYSFQEALPALEEIRKRSIPLILCSSKTRVEIEAVRRKLGNRDPFIVENGGAVFVPSGYFPFPAGTRKGEYEVTVFGRPYQEIRQEFIRLRESLRIDVRGFGDMTAEEIASLTGLSPEEAVLARKREFGEPFIFGKGVDERFLRTAEKDGFHWTRGRLFYLMGDHDKGKTIRILKQWYGAGHGTLITIGLGDGLNDLPLLREVDHPVLVQKESAAYEEAIRLPNLIKADGIGPRGWNRAITRLLQA